MRDAADSRDPLADEMLAKMRAAREATTSDAAFFRRWWCFFTHSRFGIWNESGDIVCQKCDRIVWKAASTSAEYRRTYGR